MVNGRLSLPGLATRRGSAPLVAAMALATAAVLVAVAVLARGGGGDGDGEGAASAVVVGLGGSAAIVADVRREVAAALPVVERVWASGGGRDDVGRVEVDVPAGLAGFEASSGEAGPAASGTAAVAVVARVARGARASVVARASAVSPKAGVAHVAGASVVAGSARGAGVAQGSRGLSGGAMGSGDSDGRPRVVINPEAYARLSALGRQVVLRHELTHVISASVTPVDMPLWLVEGLADTVGYDGAPLSVQQVAAELAEQVAAGAIPTALPADAAFAATGDAASRAYEEGWLACRLIVNRAGIGGLVRFYQEAGGGRGTGADRLRAAFADVLHLTPGAFTATWRAYVRQQLT